MTLVYTDASVIVSAYMADEPAHAEWHARLFEADEPVVVSEIARLEVTSAIAAASRAGRLEAAPLLIARFEADCGDGGPINLLALRPGTVVERAARLTQEHQLRALDALHLAVAIEDARPLADDGDLLFATRDRDQSRAATRLGLRVA